MMLYYLSNLIFGTKPRYLDLYHLISVGFYWDSAETRSVQLLF